MTLSSSRIAYYAFGDSARQKDVDKIVLADAQIMLVNALNQKRAGLGNTADLSNNMLQLAGCFYAVHLMVKAGVAIDRSGVVASESIDGMSVSYESVGQRQMKDRTPPKDYLGMAQDMVNRFAEETLQQHKGIGVSIKNARSSLLEGFYDKYTDNYKHGVP